jgi:UDP-GlcNAc:undecaprenyl-phosphate GlcNAc-1-phosphate transferase
MDSFLAGTNQLLQSLLMDRSVLPSIPADYFRYIQFLPVFLISLAVSLLITPIVGHIAKVYRIVDIPGRGRRTKLNRFDNPERHIHRKRTPNLGGLAVIVPFLVYLILFFSPSVAISAFFIAVLLLTIVGVLDDIYNLPASVQMGAHIIAAVIIGFAVVDLPAVTNPFGGQLDLSWFDITIPMFNSPLIFVFPGDLFVIPWLILCVNALKWVSGSDALLEGNMIVILILIAVLGVRNQLGAIVAMSVLLAGGITGFTVFNFPPAKIFSASVGKTLFGFIVGVLAILNSTKIATTILILALPLTDALFVIVKRYISHRPKNLFDLMRINDKEHLHHQLIKMNFSARRILLVEASITLFFGLIAVLTTAALRLFLLFFGLLIVTLGILYVNYRANKQKDDAPPEPGDSPESKYSY